MDLCKSRGRILYFIFSPRSQPVGPRCCWNVGLAVRAKSAASSLLVCRRQEHICHFINGCSVYRFSVRHSPPQLDVFWWRPFNRSSTELRFLDNSSRHRGLSRNQALLINGSCAIGLSELSPVSIPPILLLSSSRLSNRKLHAQLSTTTCAFQQRFQSELFALLPNHGFLFMENYQVQSGKNSLYVKGHHRWVLHPRL